MNGLLSRMIFPGFVVGIMLRRSVTALFVVLLQPVIRTNKAARIEFGIMPLGDIPASPSRNCSTSFDYTSSSPLGRLGTSDTGLVLLRHYAQHESQQRLHHQVRTEKQGRPQALRERLPKTSTEDLYAVSLRLVPPRTY